MRIINMKSSVLFYIFIAVYFERLNANGVSLHRCNDEESETYPHHCHLMESFAADPERFSAELFEFSQAAGFVINKSKVVDHAVSYNDNIISVDRRLGMGLPSVLAHGMGDSCFNEGMKSITKRVSKLTNDQYAVCIPTGSNLHEDTTNGYFLNMDASIDVFAEKVKADAKLKNGFNAVGFSQGNNIIRGYIARYNDPPVNTFVSVNGVNGGVGAVPYCLPQSSLSVFKSSRICNALMEIASNRAYSDFAQKHSFQANYWRDPRPEERENYRKYSQLAVLNNEGYILNKTLNENFGKTNHFVWVMATEDRVVWPAEGEWWYEPNPSDPFNDILPMNKTEWYLKDLFGLKTANDNDKNYFESFVGNHLEFSMEAFDSWIRKYFSL